MYSLTPHSVVLSSSVATAAWQREAAYLRHRPLTTASTFMGKVVEVSRTKPPKSLLYPGFLLLQLLLQGNVSNHESKMESDISTHLKKCVEFPLQTLLYLPKIDDWTCTVDKKASTMWLIKRMSRSQLMNKALWKWWMPLKLNRYKIIYATFCISVFKWPLKYKVLDSKKVSIKTFASFYWG